MNLFTGVIVYLMVWWVTIFTILPWGVERQGDRVLGTDPGAPKITHLKAKLLINTGVSAVIWLIIYLIIDSGVIDLREIANGME